MLNEPTFFEDHFAMSGTFHMAKVLLRCSGRYLTGSGIDDALIEGKVFGRKVLMSVLGMFIVSETIYRFAWRAFLERHGDYSSLNCVRNLRDCVAQRKRDKCISLFSQAVECTRELQKEFEDFIRECQEKSELCQYLSVFQDIFTVFKKLVAADRDGNWNLHVGAVRASMPILRSFDAINYLRYSSFYLEKIKVLKETHPSLYDRFTQGYFVVEIVKMRSFRLLLVI